MSELSIEFGDGECGLSSKPGCKLLTKMHGRAVRRLSGWVFLHVFAAALSLRAAAEPEPRTVRLSPRPPPSRASVATIDFARFYRFTNRAPVPTPELLELAGKRVTLVGFMVALERPVLGGFYLSPYPASSDESGAGRGGVPPTAVLVLVRSARGRYVQHVPGALELTGVLEVGNQETSGETSTIRLRIDDARALRFARTRATLRHRREAAK
ncbi:MAG TPA: hypothetical protein VFQ61_16895 [Polyangiaceae bacterium]|nr:hypothetical protein [Polyangiaceae bacterium]